MDRFCGFLTWNDLFSTEKLKTFTSIKINPTCGDLILVNIKYHSDNLTTVQLDLAPTDVGCF